MSAPPIIPAGSADAGVVADLIATAFHRLAAAAWLVPDPAERASVLSANFRIVVEHALAHGTVHWLRDRSGVAVWFPRVGFIPEPPDYQRRLAAACGEATPRFQVLDALFDKHHPDQPHHHLAFMAVTPERQGAGLGTALIEHHHAHLDAHAIPAYLEASSDRSRDLYLRHRYQPSEPFHLPDGTPFWPMWRPPLPS